MHKLITILQSNRLSPLPVVLLSVRSQHPYPPTLILYPAVFVPVRYTCDISNLFIGYIKYLLLFAVQRSVPDMSGLSFWFTTPLCSTESPANMHVIPQTTRAVNVTIVSLDASVTIDNGLYTIESNGVLYIPLPCVSVTWGQIDSSGLFN